MRSGKDVRAMTTMVQEGGKDRSKQVDKSTVCFNWVTIWPIAGRTCKEEPARGQLRGGRCDASERFQVGGEVGAVWSRTKRKMSTRLLSRTCAAGVRRDESLEVVSTDHQDRKRLCEEVTLSDIIVVGSKEARGHLEADQKFWTSCAAIQRAYECGMMTTNDGITENQRLMVVKMERGTSKYCTNGDEVSNGVLFGLTLEGCWLQK